MEEGEGAREGAREDEARWVPRLCGPSPAVGQGARREGAGPGLRLGASSVFTSHLEDLKSAPVWLGERGRSRTVGLS